MGCRNEITLEELGNSPHWLWKGWCASQESWFISGWTVDSLVTEGAVRVKPLPERYTAEEINLKLHIDNLQKEVQLKDEELYEYKQHINTLEEKVKDLEKTMEAVNSVFDLTELTCYQCGKATKWLAPDSRCGDCTHLSVDEIRGEV